MTDYLSKDQRFQIVSNDPSLTQLSGKRFRTVYPAAPPPHFGKKTVNTRRIADTTYKIEMTNGISPLLKLDKQAYYHFYIDSARQQGLTLYRFTSQYPYVGTKMQTLMPLRYICNTREFNDMLAAKDKEKAVRKFWEEIGNTPNRTDELMADYYSLVTQANFLFTSDREGWKTDRGMIYIVFGPPNSVYKDGVNETWVYGDIESNLAVKFEFLKIDSPFTNNDYWLNRSTTYGQSWHSAVELWRR
jgi:GWxTD domain-containing protein